MGSITAKQLGPRYLDWQKPNANEEEIKQSWEECEMHARNILGEEGFKNLKKNLESETQPEPGKKSKDVKKGQQRLL